MVEPCAKRPRMETASSRTAFIDDVVKMPCTMNFQQLSAVDLKNKKHIAIAGTQNTLQKLSESSVLPKEANDVLKVLLENAKPSANKVEAMSQFVAGPGPLKKISVGCLTTEASRHMAPHRPDQLYQFCNKLVKVDKDTALLIAPESRSDIVSYAALASRGHALCDLKGANCGFKEFDPVDVAFVLDSPLTAHELKEVNVVAQSLQMAARLVDLPTNYLNTETYSEVVAKLGKKYGFDVKLIKGKQLLAEGMEALHDVGKAAEFPAVLAVLTHTPKEATDEVLAWCGKGIVYDTGGLALKTSEGMKGMKKDMGGSAAVLGGFMIAARMGVKKKVHALLAMADNAVGPLSQRNDDIVRSLAGKTIEIFNTDAEGRLALCDAVAYATKYLKPTSLLDMATLTGAQSICTGKAIAAFLTNDEEMERKAMAAGKASGDLCFPVVYAPQIHVPDIESAVADLRNTNITKFNANVSCAGHFIAQAGFVDYNGPWLHVDMSGPAWADEKATAWGVAFLNQLYLK